MWVNRCEAPCEGRAEATQSEDWGSQRPLLVSVVGAAGDCCGVRAGYVLSFDTALKKPYHIDGILPSSVILQQEFAARWT